MIPVSLISRDLLDGARQAQGKIGEPFMVRSMRPSLPKSD
jgi:hypothetical protein